MKRQLLLLFRLLRPHPLLVARFAAASLGRAVLTAASILLIREFFANVLGERHVLAERVTVESALWITVGLLLLTNLGSAALKYNSLEVPGT